jgi:radical SAM protein with 4Fe4S-binding SPASM domain
MDPALFRHLMDEIGDYLFLILFWDWGEPFVNPGIYDMIADAHARGIRTVSSSNGHPFAHGNLAERVVRSGLDTLIFAIDGATQETYQRYRQGGDLQEALAGVRRVVECKRALGSRTPLVNFRFIVMKHNEHELPRVRALADELGADALVLKTMNPYAQDPYSGARADVSSWEDFVPSEMRYRRFKENRPGERRRLARNPCKNLWHHPTVHWNGVVSACTYDPREMFPLGDLRTQSFADIWRGPAYRDMRARFRRESHNVALCRECSYAYAGGNCQDETMAEATFFERGGGIPAGSTP